MACAPVNHSGHWLLNTRLVAGCTLNDSGAELLAEAMAVNQTLDTVELPGADLPKCSKEHKWQQTPVAGTCIPSYGSIASKEYLACR